MSLAAKAWVPAYTFTWAQPKTMTHCVHCNSLMWYQALETDPDSGVGMGSIAAQWICFECGAQGPIENIDKDLIK